MVFIIHKESCAVSGLCSYFPSVEIAILFQLNQVRSGCWNPVVKDSWFKLCDPEWEVVHNPRVIVTTAHQWGLRKLTPCNAQLVCKIPNCGCSTYDKLLYNSSFTKGWTAECPDVVLGNTAMCLIQHLSLLFCLIYSTLFCWLLITN